MVARVGRKVVWGVALLWGAIVGTTWLRPRAWKWIAGTATVAVELWYTWRGYAARTHGANMTGAGSMFLLLPVAVVTFLPTWITSWVVQRRDRRPGAA